MHKNSDYPMKYKTIRGREIAALLHPRPAVLVTCCDANESPNILTIAWHTPLSHDPPLVGISVGTTRYSHRLISQVGEFVINIVGQPFLEALQICGKYTGELDDKVALARLTPLPAKTVKPCLIAQALGYLECRVVQQIPTGDHTLFIGEVLQAQVDEMAFSNMWNYQKSHVERSETSMTDNEKTLRFAQGDIPLLGQPLLCLHRDKYGVINIIEDKEKLI